MRVIMESRPDGRLARGGEPIDSRRFRRVLFRQHHPLGHCACHAESGDLGCPKAPQRENSFGVLSRACRRTLHGAWRAGEAWCRRGLHDTLDLYKGSSFRVMDMRRSFSQSQHRSDACIATAEQVTPLIADGS